MVIRRSRYTIAASILVVVLAAVAIARQELVVDVNLALLTVRVRDSQGKPVPNLTSDDFEILEDGQFRPVSHFFIQRSPAAVGLLVDRSISVGRDRDAVVANVVRICNALAPGDRAFLMTFSTGTKTDVSITGDHAAIVSAIQRLKTAAGTRFYDATIDALDELSRVHMERKALIVLTDGADHYSTHTLQQVLDIAHLYGVEIDIVAYDGNDSRSWTPAGRNEISRELEKLTAGTGGELLNSSKGPETAVAIEELVDSLHYMYQLGFYSPAWFDESSRIEIRIRNRPELTVFIAN